MHFLWLVWAPATAYQLLAVFSELRYLGRRAREADTRPSSLTGVSVLKPLRGLDPNTYPAFVSQIQQDHPEFEVLFGAADVDDPAVAEVRRLQAAFPDAPVRLLIGGPTKPNAKVGLLMELARNARYPLLVVNDSDIKVTPDYLAVVTNPLSDPAIGVVTCPYRVKPHTVAAGWEALGIATDFMPSALVAQTIGVREFGFGSTLAFRAADLKAAGGFEPISEYLADDFQLAKRIAALGKRALLSSYIVETSLGEATWAGVWRHQIRWARTIRVSNRSGHAGLPIAHAGLWVLLAVLVAAWPVAGALLLLRIVSALLAARLVLQSRQGTLFCWLAPLWDLYSFAVWAASYAGNTVRWRDRLLRIDSEGRIKDA